MKLCNYQEKHNKYKEVVPDTNIGYYIMSIFNKLFNRKKNSKQEVKLDTISSSQFKGRWYGLMCCLGEQSGRDMSILLKDKGSEILTMLQLSNEFPADFKYVNQLLALEKAKEAQGELLSNSDRQSDYLLGVVEAKGVCLNGKHWEVLLLDKPL